MHNHWPDHNPDFCGPGPDRPCYGPAPIPPNAPHFIPGPCEPPPCPAMPPVPTVVEGESLYEAVNNLRDRVNVCISTYNDVMSECYKTLHNLQRAAEENGAYYGPCDVWTEEGYLADESSAYTLIHKRAVDRRGEPIVMKLGLAYDNATNSKIEQSIFSASKIKYADKIVVAQPKTANGWYGKAIWNGAPINAAVEAGLYTVGFTSNGTMRVYSNGVGIDQMRRDTIVDAMGCSGVLIQSGSITSEEWYNQIPNYDQQVARVIMGQNCATGEVIILVCGNENDVNKKGMTSLAAANILLQQGCTLAVELCEGDSAGACDKGSLMFTPDNDQIPTAYCFWYISRRRFYKNDYERELAELTQNYGQCIWQGYLNGKNITNVSDALNAEIERAQTAENNLDAKITAETGRAEAAEAALNTKIEAETERAEAAEKVLDNKISAETDRATAAEADLQQQITAEVDRATAKEDDLQQQITTEVNRAKAREDEIAGDLADEVNRATLEENRLEGLINTEAQRAKDAEAVLQQNITAEQQARQNADTALQESINQVSDSTTSAIEQFKTQVNGQLETMEQNITQLDAEVNSLTEKVNDLEGNIGTINDTVAQMNNIVNQVQQTVTQQGQSITSINQEIDTIQEQLSQIQAGTLALPYIKNHDGTFTGTLSGENATFSGTVTVPTPDADTDAVNKKYVDDADDALSQQITAESEARADEDATLSAEINTIKERVDNMENGTSDLPYIKDTGDTVTGAYDFTGATMTVAEPAEAANPATKQYVDNAVAAEASAREEADSALDAKIQAETQARTEADEAITETINGITGGTTDLGYIKKENGNATGTLAVENLTASGTVTVNTPVSGTDAANKDYVDQTVTDATGGITPDVSQLKSDVEALQQSQSEQDSRLDNLESGTTALPYLKKTGDTGTGSYNFTGATLQIAEPTQNNNPASKQYVDQAVDNATDPELTSRVDALENTVNNITDGTTSLPYLSKNGDSSSGTFNFTGTVTAPVPSQPAQVVNKQYADAAITTAVDDLKSEIGTTGPTGHLAFVDAAVLPNGSSITVSRTAGETVFINGFVMAPADVSYSDDPNGMIITDSTTDAVYNIPGIAITVSASGTTIQIMGNGGSNSPINGVSVYKFIADGDQPQPDPTTFFSELNPPVILSATTNNPQSVEGDLSATLNAMIAAQSNWFKYKMQDNSGKTYYVMSTSEIQNNAISAANVLYCTEAGTWYQGETLSMFESSFDYKPITSVTLTATGGGGGEIDSYNTISQAIAKLDTLTEYPNKYAFYLFNPDGTPYILFMRTTTEIESGQDITGILFNNQPTTVYSATLSKYSVDYDNSYVFNGTVNF